MHEVLSVVSDFDLVDYIANHEADQSELDIFADFHHRSPVDNMSMDSTQMLVDSANSQDEQGYSPSQQLHHHSQQSQQQQQHQQQHRQQSLSQHTRPQLQPSHMMTAEMLDLKDRLEQQMKLQQLQQLLLQQQVCKSTIFLLLWLIRLSLTLSHLIFHWLFIFIFIHPVF